MTMIAPLKNEPIRAAIYTRVSTEEGLDQDFNSLDAQREAGEAYVLSQQSEGWICLDERYDDGGFTGGNLKRPALERLLVDIREDKIDCVVTYKVDRLSRSLLDFARLMEEFEKHGVSYVSVTQQINSASSMGRLILNVLLSFAQFEREIIAERTRDKMRAAKRRGKWIGGRPPLGYDISDTGRSLEVNETEAEQVNRLFKAYLVHRSITLTIAAAAEEGIINKRWVTKAGKITGGAPFTKSSMHRFLTNAIFTGQVSLDSILYPGEHTQIVDSDLFDSVQRVLKGNDRACLGRESSKYDPLLKGIIRCSNCGRAMIHSTTKKEGNKVYRYYVCGKAMKEGWKSCPTKSVPAQEMENLVIEQIQKVGTDSDLQVAIQSQVKASNNEEIFDLQNRIAVRQSTRKSLQRQLKTAIKNQASAAKFELLNQQTEENERKLQQETAQLEICQNDAVEDSEVTSALQSFDSVWAELSPHERRKIVHLLIENVSFDGSSGLVSFAFKPTALRNTMVSND
jgi:site-specific DNA recombinase